MHDDIIILSTEFTSAPAFINTSTILSKPRDIA